MWSQNKIVISTDENTETIPELLKKSIVNSWGNFTFTEIMPVPTGIDEPNAKIAWQEENWGTSWAPDESGTNIDDINNEIKISCNTYGNPPLTFLQYLSSIYPELIVDIRYASFEQDFVGSATYIGGVLIEGGSFDKIDIHSLNKNGFKSW